MPAWAARPRTDRRSLGRQAPGTGVPRYPIHSHNAHPAPGVAPPAPARGLPRTCEEGPGGASGDEKIQRVKADVAFLSLPPSQSAGDRLAAGPPAEAHLLSRPSRYDAKSRIVGLSRQTFVSISLSSARRRHHARSRRRAGKKCGVIPRPRHSNIRPSSAGLGPGRTPAC